MITQGGVYSAREEGLTTSVGDPQIQDPDPRIFTGIQIWDPPLFSKDPDPRKKQCGSPSLVRIKILIIARCIEAMG